MVSLCSLMPSSAGDDVALAAARKKNENTFRNIKFQRFSGLTGSVYFDWAWSGVNWMYQGGWLETSECCWWGGWAATWTCLAQVWTLVWGNGFDSIHPVRVVGRGKHWSSGYICWMSKDSVSTHKNYIHDVSKRTIWFQKDRYFLKHIWYSNSSHTSLQPRLLLHYLPATMWKPQIPLFFLPVYVSVITSERLQN